MASPIRIHMGENHDSWDADGWIWFLAARDGQFCAIRIAPRDYAALRADEPDYLALIHALEQAAAMAAPQAHPVYRTVYDIGAGPDPDPAAVLPGGLASLYQLGSDDAERIAEWQATGPVDEMVRKALRLDAARFECAVLVANAGLHYGAAEIRQIADALDIRIGGSSEVDAGA